MATRLLPTYSNHTCKYYLQKCLPNSHAHIQNGNSPFDRATRSLNHSPDDWEGNLLRFGSWLANPMAQTSSLLQSAKRSCLERNYQTWKETYSAGLAKYRLYQVARNWTGTDSMIHFELLAHLIFKMDAALPPGIFYLPSNPNLSF